MQHQDAAQLSAQTPALLAALRRELVGRRLELTWSTLQPETCRNRKAMKTLESNTHPLPTSAHGKPAS
jgi:hypothetical protein